MAHSLIAPIILLLAAPANAEPMPNGAAPSAAVTSSDGLRVGVDTFEQVKAKLGRPTSVMTNSDGTKVAVYSNNKTKIKGSSFVPIVGLFTAGAKATVSTKTYTFDQNDILKSFSSSETTTDCHTSLAGAKCQ